MYPALASLNVCRDYRGNGNESDCRRVQNESAVTVLRFAKGVSHDDCSNSKLGQQRDHRQCRLSSDHRPEDRDGEDDDDWATPTSQSSAAARSGDWFSNGKVAAKNMRNAAIAQRAACKTAAVTARARTYGLSARELSKTISRIRVCRSCAELGGYSRTLAQTSAVGYFDAACSKLSP